jgi:hypothetical protein
MKHFFKLTCAAAVLTAGIITLSSFNKAKKATTNVDAYSIQLLSNSMEDSRGVQEWTWVLTNPNPGSGDNGTLQDVSHISIPLRAEAEAALVSAEYSYDGITWISNPLSIDRDPGIKLCTSADVLKFDVGTTGSEPLYFRITFNEEFESSGLAKCYIKTGGGRNGCNYYYFAGIANRKLD